MTATWFKPVFRTSQDSASDQYEAAVVLMILNNLRPNALTTKNRTVGEAVVDCINKSITVEQLEEELQRDISDFVLKSGTSEGAKKGWEHRQRARPDTPEVEHATIFHGSVSFFLDSILKNGIEPGASRVTGEHAWSGSYFRGDRAKSVYLDVDASSASSWGSQAAVSHIKKMVEKGIGKLAGENPLQHKQRLIDTARVLVFEVHIPYGNKDKLVADEMLSYGGEGGNDSKRYVGNIPPEWLHEYRVYRMGKGVLNLMDKPMMHVRIKKSQETVYYTPVVVFEGSEEEKSGTSEGARKGWENRKRSGPEPEINRVTLYHGSANVLVHQIMREGIQPKGGDHGGWSWSEETSGTRESRNRSVYLAERESDTLLFAHAAANRLRKTGQKAQMAVFEVSVDSSKLIADEDMPMAYRHEGAISPDNIVGYRIYDLETRALLVEHQFKTNKSRTGKYFVGFVVLDDAAEKADYEESEHPRDESGKWTGGSGARKAYIVDKLKMADYGEWKNFEVTGVDQDVHNAVAFAKKFIGSAAMSRNSKTRTIRTLRSADKKAQAHYQLDALDEGRFQLNYLAVAPWNVRGVKGRQSYWGTTAMYEVVKDVLDKGGKSLGLTSETTSWGFYKAIGMTMDEDYVHARFDEEGMRSYVRQYDEHYN